MGACKTADNFSNWRIFFEGGAMGGFFQQATSGNGQVWFFLSLSHLLSLLPCCRRASTSSRCMSSSRGRLRSMSSSNSSRCRCRCKSSFYSKLYGGCLCRIQFGGIPNGPSQSPSIGNMQNMQVELCTIWHFLASLNAQPIWESALCQDCSRREQQRMYEEQQRMMQQQEESSMQQQQSFSSSSSVQQQQKQQTSSSSSSMRQEQTSSMRQEQSSSMQMQQETKMTKKVHQVSFKSQKFLSISLCEYRWQKRPLPLACLRRSSSSIKEWRD